MASTVHICKDLLCPEYFALTQLSSNARKVRQRLTTYSVSPNGWSEPTIAPAKMKYQYMNDVEDTVL